MEYSCPSQNKIIPGLKNLSHKEFVSRTVGPNDTITSPTLVIILSRMVAYLLVPLDPLVF